MKVMDIDVDEHRQPGHAIEPLIYHRWSARAMSGESLSGDEVQRLFEAARWAPSSYNDQPWRFFYARRGGEHWDLFFNWMVEFNQGWAEPAGLLIVVASTTRFGHNGEPNGTHGFDAGAAWQNLAIQGTAMDLVVHPMAGFDYAAAHRDLGLPDDMVVHAMVAVGRPAAADVLPEDLQGQEKPNQRKSLDDIAFEGTYPDR